MMLGTLAAAGMLAAVQRPRSEEDEDIGDRMRANEPPPIAIPRAPSRRAGTSKYTPHVGAKQQAKGLKALERQRAKEAGL